MLYTGEHFPGHIAAFIPCTPNHATTCPYGALTDPIRLRLPTWFTASGSLPQHAPLLCLPMPGRLLPQTVDDELVAVVGGPGLANQIVVYFSILIMCGMPQYSLSFCTFWPASTPKLFLYLTAPGKRYGFPHCKPPLFVILTLQGLEYINFSTTHTLMSPTRPPIVLFEKYL